MKPVTDMTGRRFGRLVALDQDGIKNKSIAWRCTCDCGVVVTVSGSDLRHGNTQSCGCLRREKSVERLRKLRGAA